MTVRTPILGTSAERRRLLRAACPVRRYRPTTTPGSSTFLIEGQGNRIKLAGDVTIDQHTGQITTDFTNNPQVPFTDLRLELNGGDKSILQNPSDCGPHEGQAALEGWTEDSGRERHQDRVPDRRQSTTATTTRPSPPPFRLTPTTRAPAPPRRATSASIGPTATPACAS